MISWKMSGAHAPPVPVQTGLLRGDQALLLFSHLPVVNQLGTYGVCQLKGAVVFMLDLPNIHILMASFDCVGDTDWSGAVMLPDI